ncbi:MAG TPA: nitric oxide reductase transcriptional regulator NorR [Candidatus Krumholzibacteria bacterium]|nr:nitric oxide reductase transcriptional regulator NorR [Candidatus Krumholzibacteria bacterium]HPD70314.1 nitric oxide reductase transcriptional regulator NorR [Candidatus Krumholzibacteria bacterium]HRY39986.1 nitric oxide reductase transcriptional regulator NorR [Candidatus Krumholzibacteria bacterium]
MTSSHLAPLLEIARDLTASLAAADRYQRLLESVRRLIPFDAACVLRLDGDELVPLAAVGLAPEAVVKRYARGEHPRLDAILSARGPLRFAADTRLPDPFDGMLAGEHRQSGTVHACLGCPLLDGERIVGALTADALDPHAFYGVDLELLATFAALAGAAMRTTSLIEALETTAAQRELVARDLQRSASQAAGEQILGASAAVKALLDELAVVAASDLTVLITGETGVGKELVARHVHDQSLRRRQPLIQVNCAALPEAVAASELFGHVVGAFTGATRDRAGKFEIANGGTLFLDEIGDLPLPLQPVLLRALQQGEIQRLGSDRVHRVDVRVIAATNRDLRAAVADGRFRADLFHRLSVFPVHVPPLRERREDIPLLAAHFAEAARRRLGVPHVRIAEAAHAALRAADWPGNVRELENVVSRGVLRAARERRDPVLVEIGHLDLGPGASPVPLAETAASRAAAAPALSLAARVEGFKRAQIQEALDRHRGSWAAAARELGLHRSNLHSLAKRLGLR